MKTQVSIDRKGTQVSHYEIGELLGSGGMGEVYRATDLRLGRNVAMKFLRPVSDPEMRKQFKREAQTASLVDHPNVCTVFDVDENVAGDLFIVMAYYDGETLDKILKRGLLEIDKSFELISQVSRGLAAAHSDLIVHRDIKPANLMVTKNGTVKILDFGIAKLLREGKAFDKDLMFGTPSYVSPEQLRGGAVDQRADIWSLGVVLYEMLTGVRPFLGGDVAEVITSVLNNEPVPIKALRRELPPRIDQFFKKLLAKNPRKRYEQIESLTPDLADLLNESDTGAITLHLPSMRPTSSVAVLPFDDMSPKKDQGYLCDGIAEEILRALSRIPELYVASRTSSFQFKQQSVDIREIGMRLNVDNVLEGSVRRANDRVRISAQLINVDNGYRLWYERYDREMKDIFAIEDEIAEKIADALKVTILDEKEREHELSSVESEAYELYLQGRQFFHLHRRKSFEIAIQTFARAIKVSPDYARAYAGIADCHSFLNLYFGAGKSAIAAADEASRKALELEPDLADANSSRGLALFLQRDYKKAEHCIRRAIELDPNIYEPHYIFGRVCFTTGQMKESARHFREACALVPEAFDSWYLMGMCYRKLGDKHRARSANLECIEAVYKRIRSNPEDTRALTMGASVLVELGEPERALEWIERALTIDPEEAIIQYNSACAYVNLEIFDKALNCLEAAVVTSSLSREWVEHDPDLDPLRDDPRLKEMLDRVDKRRLKKQ
jgi:non-specific serine/threonine protein kinase